MFLIRTPLRISFLGGGTDHPDWFLKHGGAVLSASIDKYIYLVMRKLPDVFSFRYRIVGKTAQEAHTVEEINNPVIKTLLKNEPKIADEFSRLEIIYWSDLPSRSGMGSSSAFVVGLLNGFAALANKVYSPDLLAKHATEVEREMLKETVGNQDQIAAVYGGFNLINFLTIGSAAIGRVVLPEGRKEALEQHLMLFYTGINRTASTIEAKKLNNYAAMTTELDMMREQVTAGHDMLRDVNQPIHKFGHFLSGSFQLKKMLSPEVSNERIDKWYEKALTAGATGGKLLGAGGGGFLLFIVQPEFQDKVRMALGDLQEIKIKFSDQGSSVARLA